MQRIGLLVLLACAWFILGGCAAPELHEVPAMTRINAYRQKLHWSVDRISDLAAGLDRLEELLQKKASSMNAHPSEAGEGVLRDVLWTTQRCEYDLMERISALENELCKPL